MTEPITLATTAQLAPAQNESIEVTRNTKGYNWTVKILSTDLERLVDITSKLNSIYPASYG
jgi:hypothetical protein